MNLAKLLTRIFIWSFVGILIVIACFIYSFGDINKLKKSVEENLRNQLTCTVKLGELSWDWNGFNLGVTTSTISLYDKENNIVLQGGPTRFVWNIKNILTGSSSHFYSIDSSELYVNAIRDKNGVWNLISMFPSGPPPKVDNLRLHNTIIYLIDELNQTSKKMLYKDLNLVFEKRFFSNKRKIDLTTRIGSLTSPSFVKIKGKYTEDKKFNWSKSEIDLFLVAKKIDLANWFGYFSNSIKEPQIKKFEGEFTGVIRLNKVKRNRLIKVRMKTKTNNFIIELKNKDGSQLIEIPKTDLAIKAFIDQEKIYINYLRSNIDELNYSLNGYIYNWSKNLPEVNLDLKTNKFNFKAVKPFLPLSLLPPTTRNRIEPINDDGFVEIDVNLKGPLIAPKYNGTVLLSDFNLTAESGFLNVIQGLNGKLTLKDDILAIDYLNIPIKGSPLTLKGEVDSKKLQSTFNLHGKNLDSENLINLIAESGFDSSILKDLSSEGNLDLNIDVVSIANKAPDIMGKVTFHNVGLFIPSKEPLVVNKIIGDLLLDGSKVTFSNLTGLINAEPFFINGDLSLKEDEKVNLLLEAKHLRIIPYVLSLLSAQTKLKPIAESITGEASDLNLNISGVLTSPILYGMVLINNVSFNLPHLADKISNITGGLQFEGTELLINEIKGKIQNSDFAIAGYIEDLLSKPKPTIRIVSQDVELSNIWSYIKEQLKVGSLSTQIEALEKFKGIAAIDIFLHPDAILGNVFFKDMEIKYKLLPFDLKKLSGRLVIGDKDISLFDLMGAINDGNDFNCNLMILNYLTPDFNIEGQLWTNLDLPSLIKAINAYELNKITTDGLIPTTVTFDTKFPWINLNIYSLLSEMLQLELPPYIRKPTDKEYTISTNLDLNSKDMNIYLNNFNIKSNMLSLSATGNIKNITSTNPAIALHFATDEPCGLFMITEPIIPIMDIMIWGMIELNGSVTGSPSMYAVASNATISEIMVPDLLGKKLTASDGTVNIYLDTEQGVANGKLNNIKYASLDANSVSLSLNYSNPVIYCNEFSVDANPGSIFGVGSFNPVNNLINLTVNGNGLELSSLGSFLFLDPTKISGTTDFSIMLNGQGKTKEDLTSKSTGNVLFSIKDGKIGQVALLHKGLQLANLLGQGIFGFNLKNVLSLFFKYQDGSFNQIQGNFDIKDGKVSTNEFLYRAEDLNLNSYGFIDLNNLFVGLSFYGHLPRYKTNIPGKQNKLSTKIGDPLNSIPKEITNTVTGALSIIPNAIGEKRFFIPFLSSTPPAYFKFEVKGDIKNPKQITSQTRRSFKWLKGNKLRKERKFLPK